MPDVITQIFPWKKLTIDTWKSGEVPLWNPYLFSGTPHAGNYQSAVFSPINILFFVFPFIDAWSLHVLLQPLCAGFCMFLFLRAIKVSTISSLLGTVSFMFFGFMTVWMAYGTLGWAIVVFPLALFGVVLYEESSRWRYGVLIALSIAFSFLSGHYQISMYVVGALMLFILGYTKKKGALFLFVFLGMLLSSVQVLTTLHAYLQSNRGESFTTGSIPWSYILTLFAPDVYGNPVTRNDWFGQYAEWASYIGVIPLFLAIYGAIFSKKKGKIVFLVMAIMSLLVSFASPLNALLYAMKISIISTSVATRMIVLFSFSLIVLSSFGFDQLKEDWQKKGSLRIQSFSLFIVFFLGIAWVYILFFFHIQEQYMQIVKRNMTLPTVLSIVFVGCLILGRKFRRIRKAIIIVFLLCVSFDLLRFSLKWMPFDPRDYVYPSIPLISYLQKEIGNDRAFGTFGNELAMHAHIPFIEGYDAMYQKRYGEFISAASKGTIEPLERSVVRIDKHGVYTKTWFDILGVNWVLYRKSDGRHIWTFPHWEYPDYVSVYEDEHYEILKDVTPSPRFALFHDYVILSDKNKILSFLANRVERGLVVLEEDPSIEPKKGEVGNVEVISYRPNSVRIKATTDTPRILFLSEVFDPGWKVKVNEKESKVLRANHAFRAVAIPEGISIVDLYYQPRLFMIGVWISGFTCVVLLFESLRRYFYDRRNL